MDTYARSSFLLALFFFFFLVKAVKVYEIRAERGMRTGLFAWVSFGVGLMRSGQVSW